MKTLKNKAPQKHYVLVQTKNLKYVPPPKRSVMLPEDPAPCCYDDETSSRGLDELEESPLSDWETISPEQRSARRTPFFYRLHGSFVIVGGHYESRGWAIDDAAILNTDTRARAVVRFDLAPVVPDEAFPISEVKTFTF